MSWDFNFSFMSYGPNWRAHRRCFHQYFNQNIVEQYLPVQLQQTHLFLQRALDVPGKLPQQIRLSVLRSSLGLWLMLTLSVSIFAGIILNLAYGMDIEDLDDEYVTLAQTAMEGLGKGHIPGAHWVEYFPIMKRIPSWVPGAKFQKLADEYRPIVETMVQKPFENIRKAIVSGICSLFS